MSEDEEDFFSEEEWLAIDDGDQELADELVLDTMHSPIYLDELAVDAAMNDSDSDWEWEYLDTYFDQDPSGIPKSATSHHTSSGRGSGRKRKRGMVDENGSRASVDPTTFEGIVWRKRAHDDTPTRLFKPGEYKEFALLKNWRDMVRKPQPDKARVHEISEKPSLATGRNGEINGRDGGRPRKKTKVDTAEEVHGNRDHDKDDYEFDGDEDGDRPAHMLPPASLAHTDDGPKGQNNRKSKVNPKRGKRPPSRLSETVSAEEAQQEASSATVPAVESRNAVADPESGTTRKPEADSLPRGNASRGKKRKAPEHTDQADRKVNGETAGRPTTRRKLEAQSKEQQVSEPSRRSGRQRKKT